MAPKPQVTNGHCRGTRARIEACAADAQPPGRRPHQSGRSIASKDAEVESRIVV
jgi:hypothetical protein